MLQRQAVSPLSFPPKQRPQQQNLQSLAPPMLLPSVAASLQSHLPLLHLRLQLPSL
jgi:hypothetical protein